MPGGVRWESMQESNRQELAASAGTRPGAMKEQLGTGCDAGPGSARTAGKQESTKRHRNRLSNKRSQRGIPVLAPRHRASEPDCATCATRRPAKLITKKSMGLGSALSLS